MERERNGGEFKFASFLKEGKRGEQFPSVLLILVSPKIFLKLDR